MKKYNNMEHRLLANSFVDRETGCWEWLGNRVSKGYGKLSVWSSEKRKSVSKWAHRIAYETLKGSITEGEEIDHLCNNPGCINPDHLEAKARIDNLARRRKAKRKI